MVEGTPGAPFEDEVVVRRRRWASADSGFAVLDADRDGDEIVLVGPLAHLEERERARVAGVWQDDRRFGLQVKVAVAEPLAPAGDAALLTYLRRVRHVGLTRAARLLERYGDDVLDAIDHDPHAAFRRLGLNPKRTGEAVKSWHGAALHPRAAPAARAARARLARPAAHQPATASGPTTRCAASPYELTSVFGVGFAIADTIARAAGRIDPVARARAGVAPRAGRGGARRLHLPAGARAGGQGGRAAGRRRRRPSC